MTKGAPTTGKQHDPAPRIFISYSHKDNRIRERLEVHLSPLKREGIKIWIDTDMAPGDELGPSIRRALKKADIFLAVASPDYLHSSYCFEKEYQFALRKAKRKAVYVLVAIARQCQWKHTKMGHYLALPKDGKPIEDFGLRTRAYEQIVEGVRVLVSRVRADRAQAVARPTAKRKPKRAKPALRKVEGVAPASRQTKPGGTKPGVNVTPGKPQAKARPKSAPASSKKINRTRRSVNPSRA